MTKKNYYLKRTTGIYCITHTESGKQYCGQSVDCFERFKQHSTPKKASAGIKGAIMKHGVDAFSFVILEECSKEELNEKEVYWIAELGTLSPGGYNLTSGGGAGTVVSEETRSKIVASRKGKTHSSETCAKIGAAHKGMTRSPETCEKLRLAFKGKTHSSEARAKIGAAQKTKSPETIAKHLESRRRNKAARMAASYTEPLQEALQSLKTDKTWIPMDSESTPLSAAPAVAPPTIEELEELLEKLKSCGI